MKDKGFIKQLVMILGIGLPLLMGCGSDNTPPSSVSQNDAALSNGNTEKNESTDNETSEQTVELSGNVMEFFRNGIMLNEGEIAAHDEDTGEVLFTIDPNNKDWTRILFHEDTVFKTSQGQGENHQISPATLEDIYLEDSVDIVGRETDEGIMADEVRIFIN